MRKVNPLFVDSTKPIDDKVVTNVELVNVIPGEGEALYLEVTDQFDFVQKFVMNKIETKKSVRYTAEVWLKDKHKISYRFLIVKDGQELQTSATFQGGAGQDISEKWEPCLKQTKPKAKKTKTQKPAREIKSISSKPLGQSQMMFDGLKSLLDDLS